MKYEIQHSIVTITQCKFETLDQLFQYLHIAKKTKYAYLQNSRIKINLQIVKTNRSLQMTDQIQIHFMEEEDMISPLFENLQVVYEDDLFLIVDKPSGMLVHSDGVNTEHTLCNLVKGYYICHQIHAPVRPIHRLDMETTGLVIFCKLPFFQPLLDNMLQTKQIQRQYYAFVKGIMKQKKITITQAIGRDRHNAKKMRISSNGKAAKTTVYIREYMKDMTCIECHLHTGRTHQIRVHMAYLKHPLINDTLYGEVDQRIPRLALHAFRVLLYHPLLQKDICIECCLPEDMKKLLSSTVVHRHLKNEN